MKLDHALILDLLRQAAFIARYGTDEERCGKAYPQGPQTIVPDDWNPGDPPPAVVERGAPYPPPPNGWPFPEVKNNARS